ncbi:MAG: NADH-quinone oxidoreductase subunit H [Elusimicrobia bacterium]|nr:NADH-quinone oxidoreductase subunit H [Elusimicrobiota bacterium]
MLEALFAILVFPGFLFLSVAGLFAEYVDRIFYARLQNRLGPPWFQPFADFIKLISKEDIIPEEAEPRIFKALPVIAVASVATSFLYIPLWKDTSLLSFQGDIIVVLYLLTIPTLTFFLGGWYSTSLFSIVGATRVLTQFFAYEVPLFMGILSAALLANSWSLSDIIHFYHMHPLYMIFNIIGFVVSLIALQGKLEKVPFDIPEAETEIVAGAFTEYSGRFLAFFRIAIDMELVAGAALISAIFLPFGYHLPYMAGFFVFILKTLFIIFLLSVFRSLFARLRIDQMTRFCWKYLAPAAILQIFINLLIGGFLLK